MLTGKRPWKAKSELELIKEILQFDLEKFLPNNLTNKSKLFLRRSLCVDYESRMRAKQLIKFKESYSENEENFLKVGENPEKIITSSPLDDKKEKKIENK